VARDRTHGDAYYVGETGARWWWHSTCICVHDGMLVLTPNDEPALGRWLRCVGFIDIALPIDWTLANNAAILTVPLGARLKLLGTYLEVTESFHGTGNPSVSLSSTHSGMQTPGSIAGGTGGETLPGLTAGIRPGTIGTSLSSLVNMHDAMLTDGDEIRWRRSGGSFTSGKGLWHLTVNLLTHPGSSA